MNAYHQTFGEMVDMLGHGCNAVGMTCRARRLGVFEPTEVLKPGPINVLLGHLLFSAENLADTDGRIPFAVWQLEPLSAEAGLVARYPRYLDLLRRASWVWDYNANNIAFLNRIGIERTLLLPFGFGSSLQVVPRGLDKVYDACLFGCLTPRRRRILDDLARAGVEVMAREQCYGEERNRLIAQSRICLNIHAEDGITILEEARLSMLLANRCFVLSEVSDHNPYGRGVAYARAPDMAAACRYWLAQPETVRDGIAETGHQALCRRPFLPSLRQALDKFTATPG